MLLKVISFFMSLSFLSCFLLCVSVSCPLWCRSQSAGRLSDMLLMAAFGPGGLVGDRGSTENLTSEKAIDITGRHGLGFQFIYVAHSNS